jgi:hypothetical protein
VLPEGNFGFELLDHPGQFAAGMRFVFAKEISERALQRPPAPRLLTELTIRATFGLRRVCNDEFPRLDPFGQLIKAIGQREQPHLAFREPCLIRERAQ